MRVAVFTNLNCYLRNGTYWAEEQSFRFWLALAEHFTHLTLCLPTGQSATKGHFPLEYDAKRVTICRLPSYKSSADLYLKFPAYARKATRLVKPILSGLDLMVAVVPNVIGLHLARLAEKQAIRTVLYVRGDVPNNVLLEYALSRWRMIPYALSLAIEAVAVARMKRTTTFVVGPQLEEKYRRRGANPIPIITSLIKDSTICSDRQLQEKQLYTLLSVGRLSPEKGVESLLDALQIMKASTDCPAFRCLIVGDGSDAERLKGIAKQRKLQGVTFTGYLPFGPKLTDLYQGADLFVNPSYAEGFPKTLLEAMACACPIVCTAVGSVPKVMTHQHDALIVPPHDAPALAEAMERSLKDCALRQNLMEAGIETVRQYTEERMCELFMSHLKKTPKEL